MNPQKISAGSKIKVWWICRRDDDHKWYATIKDRAQKDSSCPFCAVKLNISETRMYEITRSIFKDTEVKYRFKPEGLNRMELDVYIPNPKLGFEYQGVQHFKPIDFFGGEETFVEQVEKDKLKKKYVRKEE